MPHVRPDAVVASALADSDAGMRDADNAAKHGVAVKTIRRWRRLYQRRGLQRGQSHTRAVCPICQEEDLDQAAYCELLGWYLGDGWIEEQRCGVYALHIYNDAKYVELNAGLLDLMRRVKPGGRPRTRMAPGCVITTMSWRHWPCLFPQHGAGRKHERALELAPWQRDLVEEHPGAFLRGLFHSDGCRVNNWATREVQCVRKRYEYPRWQLTNHSEDILRFACEALDLLGVPWRRSSWKHVSVSRRDGVAVLDEVVGPKR